MGHLKACFLCSRSFEKFGLSKLKKNVCEQCEVVIELNLLGDVTSIDKLNECKTGDDLIKTAKLSNSIRKKK